MKNDITFKRCNPLPILPTSSILKFLLICFKKFNISNLLLIFYKSHSHLGTTEIRL
jgi:hypothetical protein